MPETTPCKRLGNCIQFQDFVPSSPTDKLYINKEVTLTVTCPAGTQATQTLPAGIVGYVLKFAIGSAPYPNLVLNCTGGQISIPVPDDVTQAQLDDLINGMLTTCLNQIAINIGCLSGSAGTFFNTQQNYNPCGGENACTDIEGALPAGVTNVNSQPVGLTMAAGVVQSTISVADANAKAQQVLAEIYSTGNVICATCGS
jgi:hypothetical protein